MKTTVVNVDGYRIEPLGPSNWDAFADFAERHNGVWGGCWCTWFHRLPGQPGSGVPEEIRQEAEGAADGTEGAEGPVWTRRWKEHLVRGGNAHAALVFDGDVAVAWAQYGTVAELPNIHHRKDWEKGLVEPPDYRITCLFVDRRYRKKGVAAVAVRGALALIGAAGGGLVESYPHDLPPGKKSSASFLYNATRSMYERLGFDYQRPKGAGNCVMTKVVPAG